MMSIFLASIIISSNCFAGLLKLEPAEVTLKGKITIEKFRNINGYFEKEFVLKLKKPIDVEANAPGSEDVEEASPKRNLKKIQLIIVNKQKIIKKKYMNKEVTIMGTLFYAELHIIIPMSFCSLIR